MGYPRRTTTEKQYLRGIIRNLSLQRWTDQEISDYLHTKNMNLARCQVTIIKNNIEKEAETWYIELKSSRYKFIAMYKERLDSLLSYQKTLNDIVTTTKKEENKIRAIATLQSIELDIFNIYKQLPEVRIEETIVNNDKEDPQLEPTPTMDEAWGSGSEPTPTSTLTSSSPATLTPSIDGYAIPPPTAIETTTTRTVTSSPSPNTSTTTEEKEKEEEDDYVWELE